MAARRKIIRIDEEKCTGCGECVPNCPEGALRIIDGKARLVSDLFCDGLGACIGHCPEGAISIEEREAVPYDERKVMENIVRQGPNTIRAHLDHLREHGADEYHRQALEYLKEKGIEVPPERSAREDRLPCGCPGTAVRDLSDRHEHERQAPASAPRRSRLRNWPVQLALVPPGAPYFRNADLLIAADCVPFAFAAFHEEFLTGKVLLIGCPKLDDAELYRQKLARIFAQNEIRSVTCVHMEVPCCYGLVEIVKAALAESGKEIPFSEITIGVKGEKLAETAAR